MKQLFLIVLISSISIISFSQLRIIDGKVSNIGGGILSGVEVSAKEAPAIFTLTDGKGKYKLEIPDEVKGLVFSYSGMADKIVKIGELKSINVKLIPAKHKTFRFGIGVATGASGISVYNTTLAVTDTTNIQMIPVAINADIFYRIKPKFELQGSLTDGINFIKMIVDSITPVGDTISVEKRSALNRLTFSLIGNYHFNIFKSGNHSAFVGFGPQFQHLSFLKTNTIGARFQAGASINNYGFTTRLFLAIDVSSGQFEPDNIYVPDLPYQYISSRLGIVFIF